MLPHVYTRHERCNATKENRALYNLQFCLHWMWHGLTQQTPNSKLMSCSMCLRNREMDLQCDTMLAFNVDMVFKRSQGGQFKDFLRLLGGSLWFY